MAAALLLSLCGCTEKTDDPTGDTAGTAATVDFSQTDSDMFTDRDLEGTWKDAVAITLSGNSASCAGTGVSIDGNTVTITAEGTYLLTGSLSGSIVVMAGEKDKVQLVLSGAQITNDSGTAICILTANKVFVTLADGTENSLESGETMEAVGEYEPDAALYSRCDLTLNGSGSLSVTAPAGHGISGKDDLAVTGGSYNVVSANQAVDANNSVRICGGTFTLDSGKDGIHAEHSEDANLGYVYISGGSFNIEAEGDGISASAYLQIETADITILAGGGYENGDQQSSDNWGNMGGMQRPGHRSSSSTTTEDASSSMKGLKAASGMLINGGTFNIDSADDALHSDAEAAINGGTFTIASGDDAVHAETTLTITNCTMNITTCYEGLEAEKIYVRGGDFTMTCSDDGLNASGGTDGSGTGGGRDGMFGGGMGGGMGTNADAMIEISGGTLRIYACGDGLDSNGNLTISGGYTYVTNPKSGDVSVLDSQNAPIITGGTYIGLGISTSMAETFSSSSTQGVIACTTGTQQAGSQVTITDSDGNVILETATEYTTVLMIVSTPEMVKGESYTITIGSVSGTLKAS